MWLSTLKIIPMMLRQTQAHGAAGLCSVSGGEQAGIVYSELRGEQRRGDNVEEKAVSSQHFTY